MSPCLSKLDCVFPLYFKKQYFPLLRASVDIGCSAAGKQYASDMRGCRNEEYGKYDHHSSCTVLYTPSLMLVGLLPTLSIWLQHVTVNYNLELH